MSATSIHVVHPDAFGYAWDNSVEPALEVHPGETVLLHARDASDGQVGRDASAGSISNLDFAHVNPISGPVFVKGARPGDVLIVEILELSPTNWGWTAIIPGFGLLADEFEEPWLRISEIDTERGDIYFSHQVLLPLRPFPGTIGVAPATAGEHSVIPPTRWGGNLDTKHLTVGSTLYLPVGIDGALFSLGDTHAAQGDGEVCGTAVETAMDVVVRLSLRKDLSVTAPQLHAPAIDRVPAGGHHICTGIGPDLMEAARDAVRAMISYLGERHGIDRQEAYALTSIACDLRIHELVDAPNWVVGALLPDYIFA